MRNLKRVLSLALATVMLLGMMVIGAGAADAKKPLTDLDKVTNKEAVTLLVDLGLIGGKPDGSYGPTEIVDRATMAKLITIMMMGDVDQNSFKGATTDLTDINGNWAEGYIKFCYSNKIISGDGQGHFNPSEPVTTAAAAKMLLVAIGYVASDRGYEGASWALNVMRDAQSTREEVTSGTKVTRPMTKGTSVKANDPLTRDNAAQMIFNTLFVKTQKPVYQWDGGKQYIQYYSELDSLAVTACGDPVRVTGVLTNVTLLNKVYSANIGGASKTISANPTDIGTKVVYYTKGNAGSVLSSTAVAVGGQTILATSTKGTAIASLVNSTDKKNYIGFQSSSDATVPANPTVLANGAAQTWTTDVATTLGTGFNKAGSKIEFIDIDGDNKYDVVKGSDYKLAEVTAVTEAKGDKEATVTIAGLGTIGNLNASTANIVAQSKLTGETTLAKGDVILYNVVGDTATANSVVYLNIAKPQIVSGKLTGLASDKTSITVDTTKYSVADVARVGVAPNVAGFAHSATGAIPTTYQFYLDTNGYAVALATATDAGISTNYATVIGSDWVAPSVTNNFAGSLNVMLLLSDSTKESFTVKTLGGTAPSSLALAPNDVITFSKNADGTLSATKLTANKTVNTTEAATTITKGNATVKVVTGSSSSVTAYANDKTVYFYFTGTVGTTGLKTATYIGKDNAPTYSTSAAGKVALYTDGKSPATAKVVLIMDPVNATGTGEYAYVLDATKYTEVESGKMYSVVINGVKTTLLLPTSNSTLTTLVDASLYTVVTLANGTKAFADAVTYETTFKAGSTVAVMGSGYVVLATANLGEYKLAEDVRVYNDSVATVDGTLSVGDAISFLYTVNNGVNTITDIFITTDA